MDKEEIFARRLDKSKKKREHVTKEAVSEHKEKKLAEKTELSNDDPKNPEDPEHK
jgi:adenylate kinase